VSSTLTFLEVLARRYRTGDERPRLRALAVVSPGSLGLVAAYSLYCHGAAVLVAAHLG
jgi:hypothetical protein